MTNTLESQLRLLDPASADVSASTPRAQHDLAAILASDSGGGIVPRRRGVRLAAGWGVAAAAAVAAIVALPAITGGDQAFASWTSDPAVVSTSAAAGAADACRAAMRDGAAAGESSWLQAAKPVLAERRGDWTTVVLSGANGFSATCITDASAHLFADMIGSVGTPSNYLPPAAHDIQVTDLGTGTLNAGEVSMVAGSVGADITKISYDSASRGVVTATVAGGRFALWYPGDELRDASRDGVTLTVTYTDGRTVTRHIGLRRT